MFPHRPLDADHVLPVPASGMLATRNTIRAGAPPCAPAEAWVVNRGVLGDAHTAGARHCGVSCVCERRTATDPTSADCVAVDVLGASLAAAEARIRPEEGAVTRPRAVECGAQMAERREQLECEQFGLDHAVQRATAVLLEALHWQ